MNKCCYNCAFYDQLCNMELNVLACDICTLDFHTINDAHSDVCEAFNDNNDNYHTLLLRAYETLKRRE